MRLWFSRGRMTDKTPASAPACKIPENLSRSFWIRQLLRGLLGVPLFVGGILLLHGHHLWEGLGVLVVSLFVLKGCPFCWLFASSAHAATAILHRRRSSDPHA